MSTTDFTVSFEPAPLEKRVSELERHVGTIVVNLTALIAHVNELTEALVEATRPASSDHTPTVPTDD